MVDYPSKHRGTTSRESQGPKLHALILGEPTDSRRAGALGYPLSPVSPSKELPFALLPLCNTPIIDYILENLVMNGVNEVTVLVNSSSMPKVHQHLSTCHTARGKPWLSSDAIKVNLLEGVRNMANLAEVVSEIRDRNVVPQSGSFLFVPIDRICCFRNLRECFAEHLEKARTVSQYAATLLCTSSSEALNSTLSDVLTKSLAEQAEMAASPDSLSPLSADHHSPTIEFAANMAPRSCVHPLAVLPQEAHTMVVLEKHTNVVLHMARLEVGDEMPEPAVITFSKKVRTSVRMDLIPTGYLFCCCEALALMEFHVKDLYSFLCTTLLGNAKALGNVFGVAEVATADAIVEPVNSPEAYIQANLNVCSRRLFPLTRESCFAEAQAKYAVWSLCETVYMHTTAKVLSQQCGPHVVAGPNVCVPASADLAGAVCGANVVIGEDCSIIGCVLLEGAEVGSGCTLRGCVIGSNAVIGDCAHISGCVIGSDCVVGSHSAEVGTSGGVVLSNVSVTVDAAGPRRQKGGAGRETSSSDSNESSNDSDDDDSYDGDNNDDYDDDSSSSRRCSETSSEGESGGKEQWLLGTDGVGRVITDRWINPVVPTANLFTADPIPRNEDSDEESAEDDRALEDFQQTISTLVEEAINHSGRIAAIAFSMNSICLSAGLGYPELCELVTELLVAHLLEHDDSDGEVDDSGELPIMGAARELFGQWCRPFYNDCLSKNGTMNLAAMGATLEGLCSAVSDPSCILHWRVAQLVEILYNDCDEDMYNGREYCIVSGEGLIAFDADMAKRRETLQQYATHLDEEDHKESRKVMMASMCHEFIMDVKNFIEGDDGA